MTIAALINDEVTIILSCVREVLKGVSPEHPSHQYLVDIYEAGQRLALQNEKAHFLLKH